MTSTTNIRKQSVIAIDDHAVIASAIKVLVESTTEFQFAGSAQSIDAGIDLVKRMTPDLVVTDLIFPVGSGYTLLDEVRKHAPHARILVFTAVDEMLCAMRCIQHGAKGLIVKGKPIEMLLDAIREIGAGGAWFSETTKSHAVECLADKRTTGSVSPLLCLSAAELTVFQMIGKGMTTKEIAKSMCRSGKTIETYRSRIKSKLGLENSLQLAQHAVSSLIGL